MEFTYITIAIVAVMNLYLFLFGGLTDVIVVGSGALLIGLMLGRIIAKFEDYDDYDYDDYDDEDYECEEDKYEEA